MIKSFLKRYFWFIMVLLFLLFRAPSLFEPYWYGDEGIYLALGQGIRHGLTLYTEIHDNKPPLLYYLAAFSQTVFGFRLLLLLVMIPTICLFYRLADIFLSKRLAKLSTFIFLVLSSVPLIEGNIANAEIFMLLPTILGIYLFYYAKTKLHYFLSSLSLGLAFSLKVPVIFEFFYLILFLVLNKFDLFQKISIKEIKNHFASGIKTVLVMFLGFFLPTLLFGIYFYFKNALPQFIFAALTQNFGYLSSWVTGTHSAPAASSGLLLRLFLLLVYWLLIYLLVLKDVISKKSSFIFFWFGAALFASLLSSRPYPHYLIQVLPSFCLLISFLFYNRFVKYIALISLFILAYVVYHFRFYFYHTLTYYTNFYSYAIKLKDQSQFNSFFGSHVETNQKIVDYIQKNTSKTDRIFVWGDEPYLYPLSDRLPASKFTVAYHIVDFNAYSYTINELKIRFPKIVIYYPMSNRPYPELNQFLNRYYFISQNIGPAVIYQQR